MADKTKTKVYGLILPKQKPEQTKTRPAQQTFNVFGNESDEDCKPDAQVSLFRKNAGPSKIKKQTQVDISTALLEDPNVYEYDNIYDEIQASKPKVGGKEREKNTERKPRYIMGLLKAAEQKKKEDERRIERKVQKEREAEGEMFADKEKFVTSAYKQKMLEMQEEEEKERREAAFEAMTDVRKQKDMSGFYRYLYRETTGNEVTPASGGDRNVKEVAADVSEVKTELESSPKQESKSSSSEVSSSSESSSSDGIDSETEAVGPKKETEFFRSNRPKAGSNFRKRGADSSSSEEGTGRSKAKKSLNVRKKSQRSLSKSMSPKRKGHNKDYLRREGNRMQSSRDRKSQSRSPSPVSNRRRTERSRSKEIFRKDHARENQLSGTREVSKRSVSREKSRRSRENSRRSREKSRRSLSREKSRRSLSREKSRRSLSREKSRRSREKSRRSREKSRRSREKSRRSVSREKSRKSRSRERHRSRSQDKYRKEQSNKVERVQHSRSQSVEGKRKEVTSRSPSSDENNKKGSRRKSTDGERKKSDKTEMKEKDKYIEKQHTDFNERNYVGAGLKTIRGNVEKEGEENSSASQERPSKPIPVDPAKKVYPHHNSPHDVAEARKRYLQRKAVREGKV